MADEAVVSSAEPVVASQESVISGDVSQYISEDGSFQEGWIDGLVPEDLRNDIVFKDMAKTNPNVKDTLKMLGNLQRVIGKKGLVQPTDSSTPSEWDAFYKTLGRPDKPEAYKLEYPKDMPIPEDADMRKAFLENSFKSGKTQKQVQADYEWYNNLVKSEVIKQGQRIEQERIDSETQLKTELGGEYEDYIHWGNRLISENTAEGEPREKLLAKHGNDPDLIRFLGNIGKKHFAEHKGVPTNTERTGAISLVEAKSKMDEIARTLADKSLVYNNPGLHTRLTQEMAGLAKLVSPR